MKKEYINDSFHIVAGNVLRSKREQAGLSLSQLASKMKNKTTKQLLSLYETGNSRIKITNFIDICYILNLDPQEVFDEINMKYLKSAKLKDKGDEE